MDQTFFSSLTFQILADFVTKYTLCVVKTLDGCGSRLVRSLESSGKLFSEELSFATMLSSNFFIVKMLGHFL